METSWNDLKLFLIVARCGSLSGASEQTGISAPTIGRRMMALERDMGRALFERSRQGYVLAPDGQTLASHVQQMWTISENITHWSSGAFQVPFVSIGADGWLAGFVADHAPAICNVPQDIRFCCKPVLGAVNLTNRECDIALTYNPPQAGNFAIRKSVKVAFSIYQARGAIDLPWVSMGKETSYEAHDRWVWEQFDQNIFNWAMSADILHRYVRSGVGKGVLPCFVGDVDEELERVGACIPDLTADLWIVMNDDDRARPEVRLAIDRVAALLEENARLLAGEKPFDAETKMPA